MTHISGVAGVVHPRLEVSSARSVAGTHKLHLLKREVGRLLKPYDLVLPALIPVYVVWCIAIAKHQPRVVRKKENSLCRVILHDTAKLMQQGNYMILAQLGERAPHKQAVESVVSQAEHNELPPHRPALAAAPCSSVRGVPCAAQQKLPLPRIGFAPKIQFHSFPP